jgi:tetratricopeptide (TPR) repeat protein
MRPLLRRPRCSALAGAVALSLSIAGPSQASPRAIEAPLPELEAVPLPRLEGLEPIVGEHLGEVVAALQEISEALTGTPPETRPGHNEVSELYGVAGRAFHAYHLLAPAHACYVNAHRLAPEDPRWVYHLALASQELGELSEAEGLYRRVAELDGEFLPARLRLAELLLKQGQADESAAIFRQSLEEHPDLAFPRAGLGQALIELGDTREGLDLLEKALAINPEADALHFPIGQGYRALGDMERARFHLERGGINRLSFPDPVTHGLRLLSRSPQGALQRGVLALQAGDAEGAFVELSQAVAAEPERAKARVALAAALERRGEIEAALEELERAVGLAPEDEVARLNLALALSRHGEAERALPLFEALQAQHPGSGEIAVEHARALERAGHLEGAVALYRRVLAADPRSVAARLGEARALAARGEHQHALDLLRIARGHSPGEPEIALALARFLASARDPAFRDGAEAMELATALDPEEMGWERAEALALALAELGRCQEAREHAREALAQFSAGGPRDTRERLEAAAERYAQSPCRAP